MSIMKYWEHLKIPFEKIDVATKNFKTCIGSGGYGHVYKGVLSINGKDTTVAVKRLNEKFGQGLKEFLTEIHLLSGQQHPNLISLLGYCDEGKEKIIVYEYAAYGSLDGYIRRHNRDESSTTLTWLERLKICVDVARGLDHLHNHIGGHQTIIHRDIKSSNILMDENLVAKISDFGLSKLGVTGFGMSLIVSNGCGTPGYCEPEYYISGIVTEKSDVYSFGIVLFEVLCGRLCNEPDNGFKLSGKSAKEYYNKGNLVKIIDPCLREHMHSYSMTKFSEIAYRCLLDDREQRPAMDVVAKELEETLNVQEAKLRKKFSKSIEAGGLAGDKETWKLIKENKDLHLPSHKVMVANIRCEQISNEKYSIFVANQDWLELRALIKSNVVSGYGRKLSSLLAMYLSSYDEEATYFDESVKNAKRKQLQDRLMQLVQPTIKAMWEHITSRTLKIFKEALNDTSIEEKGFEVAASNCTQKFMTLFDAQCQDIVIEQEAQDLAKVRDIFFGDLVSHITEVRNANLAKLTALYESNLEEAIYGPVEALLKVGSDDTWSRIMTILHQEIERAVSEFSSALSSYDVDEKATEHMISKLTSYAIGLVERKARDEAAKVLFYVKERYIFMFNHDIYSRIRVWTHKEDIQAIRKTASSSCLRLLSVLAAIRLNNDADTIWETLFLALGDSETSQITQSTLTSNTWEKIPATKTLITPVECLSVWKQLIKETEYTFIQANAAQEKYKQSERECKELNELRELEHEHKELDELWGKKLPHDYPRLIEMSDIPLNYTTKKELYLLFRHGFLANNGQLLETLSLPESRFEEVKKLYNKFRYDFKCRLESFMFSPDHNNYAWYLVFKLKDDHVLWNDGSIFTAEYILAGIHYMTTPITLKKPKEESGSSKHAYVERSWVEERDDGWLEARLTKPLEKHDLENRKELEVDLYESKDGSLDGIIVESVEFRPVVVDDNACFISGG
ncbi:serine-threonine/tyrosine-protein kinase catalytic domain-containing protein [Tanacetum coccineum]